ncbi:hypothetical protein AB6A40_003060 [Gnathostoma spinigerum]|uniref:N-methyltransferase n=1 Tax=Gnathostoma spinigerum TaxID=75299 RepID=A0ABD6EAY1_9BILA
MLLFFDMPKTEEYRQTNGKSEILHGKDDYLEHFDTSIYLKDFYTNVDDPAMQLVLSMLPNIVKRIPPGKSFLDFGAGPTIHASVAFRHSMENIYMADFLESNCKELIAWLEGRSRFDWSNALKKLVCGEGIDGYHIEEMERLTRSKVSGIFHCDCHKKPALNAPKELLGTFDVVNTIFCVEYCCDTLDEYRCAMQNITDLIRPGGYLVMGCILEETFCVIGGQKFSCLYLTEDFMLSTLRECNLLVDDPQTTKIYSFQGMVLICCKKMD